MRRGSLVGPLILILIGVLFLLNNLRPDLSLVELMANYWPYLLIAWGVLRLAELAVTMARSRPLPTYGVSGGEWVLVVFLCLAGSGLFAFRNNIGRWHTGNVRLPVLEVFGEPYDYPIAERTVKAASNTRILIENFRGNARIVGSDTAEVKVSGRKTVRALNTESAARADQSTPVDVVAQGDMIVIRTNQERAQGENRVSADLEIAVPRGASIECRGRLGDFDVSDLNGSVEVISDNAGVRADNIGGAVRIDLRRSDIIRATNVKGQVQLKGRWNNVELENIAGQVIMQGNYTGELQIRNVLQPIRFEGDQTQFNVEKCVGTIRMAPGYFNGNELVGPIRLHARSKDVQISDFTQSLDLSLDRGDIELRPSNAAKLDVHTHGGDIDVALPPNARVQFRAEANKGEITNEFSDQLHVQGEGRGATLQGGPNDAPLVGLITDRGSITLRKSSGEKGPLPSKSSEDAVSEPPEPPAPPAADEKTVRPQIKKLPKLKVEVN